LQTVRKQRCKWFTTYSKHK